MPGLINKESRGALPLSVCDITSCVRGYTLAMTASMTYENIEDHAIEGIFLYPLEENSIVVLVDEDLERTVLLVHLGLIPPLETVHVLVSTSSELCTLPCGGIRVRSPPACTPRRSSCASSPPDQSRPPPLCLASLMEEEAINSMDYQFNFQLEIRAPYLLAEPHVPHVLIESGDITPDEYDEFLHGRSDFIKAVKKDGSDLRKVRVPACTWAEEGPPSMHLG
ncbi:hypothetical protein F7725_001457 [Dissostichus mawsoni]|uniref:VIT domain-containing protein n=1 Tax=Dissostichus mawsoni TaxID=36200 RepID=A0A7J5ZHB0_DISMA|nr:hypothetical protein F7725_001457 [Dissostichus mawsoni]